MRKKLKIFLQSYKVRNYINSINIYMYRCRKKVTKVDQSKKNALNPNLKSEFIYHFKRQF
jgi:hypothetical protein